jgi:hypothetical protein
MILSLARGKAISVPRKWRRGKVSANVYWSVLSFDFITTTQKAERALPDHEGPQLFRN